MTAILPPGNAHAFGTELLSTKTFMPTPGELMAIVGRKFGERRRMLERAQLLLGARPAMGRLFGRQDEAKGFAEAAVLSDAAWRSVA